MGRNKPKEPQSDAVSAQPDIFKTLFGNVTIENATPAIFSESNPFRRKTQEPGLGFVAPSVEAVGNVSHGGSENHVDNSEVKKRKRKKEKEASGLVSEEASETPLDSKKSKKGKLQQKPNSENLNLGSEFEGVSKKDKYEASELGLGSKSKAKKSKEKNPDFGFDSNATLDKSEEGNPNLGVERIGGDGASAAKKKEKKRKRDELEREYEAKKYGVKKSEEDEEKDVVGKVVGEKRKAVDNPADMLVSNEGFDDESKLLRTVFVGNLPLKVKKKVLIKEFSKFGEVESVRIRSVPLLDTKRPRKGAILTKQIHEKADSVNGYVVFKTEESAQASLSHNMAVVEGHHIRVDRACPPRKKLKGENASIYDHKRTVFVGNLPFDVKDEEVYQLFCGINNLESNVEAIRIVRDSHYGIGKGIAYVLFKTREAANLVVKKRNLKIGVRELRLSFAKPDSTPSKRKNPSSGPEAKSPAKKLAVGSRTPDFNKTVNSKGSMSYQGLRAGKSGVQKKVHPTGRSPAKFESRLSGVKPKERKDKRPSVAARKAKAGVKGGSASKQAGMKRKLDSRSPGSSQQKKKVKKYR